MKTKKTAGHSWDAYCGEPKSAGSPQVFASENWTGRLENHQGEFKEEQGCREGADTEEKVGRSISTSFNKEHRVFNKLTDADEHEQPDNTSRPPRYTPPPPQQPREGGEEVERGKRAKELQDGHM